ARPSSGRSRSPWTGEDRARHAGRGRYESTSWSGCLSQLGVDRDEVRQVARERVEMRTDRFEITARDRTGQIEAVVDGASHERLERFRRRTGSLDGTHGEPVKRNEEIRREDGPCVIEHAARLV